MCDCVYRSVSSRETSFLARSHINQTPSEIQTELTGAIIKVLELEEVHTADGVNRVQEAELEENVYEYERYFKIWGVWTFQ